MDIFLYNPRSKKNTGEKCIKKIVKNWKNPYAVYNVLKINKVELFETLDISDRIIIVGGDGTIHHFAEDIKDYNLKQDVYLIPRGTGNDFRTSIGEKGRMVRISDYIVNLPRVDFNGINQVFVNGCGIGLDGFVCTLVNTHKNKGRFSFFRLTLKAFIKYKKRKMKIIVDDKEYEFKKVFLASIMNGKYEGGGMKMSPKSERLDNEIEVCVIHNISKPILFFMFIFIYFGKHIWKRRSVKILKGKKISIISDDCTYMQIDGEDYQGIQEIRATR